MKKQFLITLTLVLVALSSIAFASQEVIEVKLNDTYINFTDEQGNRVDPTIINDRTMVPMRKIFEALGADIQWDGATQKVTATADNKEIILQINNTQATLRDLTTDEQKAIILDSAPVILNDRTMVPVRFIAESLEKQVGWDAENRVVVIIDYDEIINNFNEKCSTFFDMLKEQTVEINTYNITTNIKGSLVYKDTEKSKNNQSITISGNLNIKKSDDKAELEFNHKMTGKGLIKEKLSEEGYTNIKVDIIFDLAENTVYQYSSLAGDKWIKVPESNYETLISILKGEVNIDEIVQLKDTELNKNSYEEITRSLDEIAYLFNNDRIKVSGKSTKTYTIKWGLDEVLSKLGLDNQEQVDELISLGKATFEINSTYKNGLNTKLKTEIDMSAQMNESKEKVSFNITAESKYNSYNKSIKITLPKASQIEE